MATPRLRSMRQRLALWLTAIVTLALGSAVYLASDQRSASAEALAFELEEKLPATTGINFVHRQADFAPYFNNVRPFLQGSSASACVSDVDRDGLLDLYIVTNGRGAKNKLYKNAGGFRFVELSLPAIEDLNEDSYSTDCLFADVNNDGFDDLLVTAMSHRSRLFLNVPAPGTPLGRSFEDISERAGLPEYLNSFTASFLDVDNDGDLDLLIAGFFRERYDPEDVAGSPWVNLLRVPESAGAGRFFPNSLGDADNGGQKYLLLNDGTGRFTDQDLAKWGFSTKRHFTWDIGTGDLNADGYTDIYIANDFGPDELYLNRKGRSFQAVQGGYPTEVGRDSFKGMNAEIADINHDGYPEIYVTNIFHPILPEGNMLWWNEPHSSGNPFLRHFTNVAAQLGVQDSGWGWGGKFVDLDLDGDDDLVVADGFISHNPNRDYWYRMSRLSGGSRKILADTKNYPAFDDLSLCGFQTTRVFVWEASRFYDRALDAGIPGPFDGRGVLLADFDLDGRVDVLITRQGDAPFVARNRFVPTERVPEPPGFVGLQMSGDGVRVNFDAVGARVKITPGRPDDGHAFQTLYREVNSGNGLTAQSMYWIVAGLGRYRGPVDAEIRWTDGRIDRHRGLEPNRYYRIVYGARPEALPGLISAAAESTRR